MGRLIRFLCSTFAATTMIHADPNNIIKVSSIHDIYKKITEMTKKVDPQKVLIAWDIDMTLIQQDNPAMYMENIKKYKDDFKDIISQLMNPIQRDLMLTLSVSLVDPVVLVEKAIPDVIRKLRDLRFKQMGFTAILAGPLEKSAKAMELIRDDQLKKVSLSFDRLFPAMENKVMETVRQYRGHYPIYHNGVLIVNGESGIDDAKGVVGVEFLKSIKKDYKYNPQFFIFIDDRDTNVQSVAKKIAEYNEKLPEDQKIHYVGFHYVACLNLKKDISKEDFTKFWQKLAKKAQEIEPSSQTEWGR